MNTLHDAGCSIILLIPKLSALAAISEITEFNIGHNIISRSVFTGLYRAVEEMIVAIRQI